MSRKMSTLVVGASGATGRLLVEQLVERGCHVKAIVRSLDGLPVSLQECEAVSTVCASVLDRSDAELAEHVHGCAAVVSCLGHNMTFRGIYGQPRRLVTDATRRLCNAIGTNISEEPTRFVLMNATGNCNRDLDETISFSQKCILALLRLLLPPHVDNENAADYLRTEIGQNDDAVQ